MRTKVAVHQKEPIHAALERITRADGDGLRAFRQIDVADNLALPVESRQAGFHLGD